MFNKEILYVIFIFFLLCISLSLSGFCGLDIECGCDDCNPEIGQRCNFSNVFCKDSTTKMNRISEATISQYSQYYRSISAMNNLCGEKEIEITKTYKDKIILSTEDYSSFVSSNDIHCNYFAVNDYFFYSSDSSELLVKVELKNKNNDELSTQKTSGSISFDFYAILTNLEAIGLVRKNDTSLREAGGSQVVNVGPYFTFEILVDISKNPESSSIDEYLEISIENPYHKKFIITIIIICFCVVLIIAVFIVAYCRFRNARSLRRRGRGNRHGGENSEENEENVKKRNKAQIDSLLKSVMVQKKYSKSFDKNNCLKCTICLEDFVEGKSIVRVTPCIHIFHDECLLHYFETNIINPVCPNCKNDFTELAIEPKKIDVETKDSVETLRK